MYKIKHVFKKPCSQTIKKYTDACRSHTQTYWTIQVTLFDQHETINQYTKAGKRNWTLYPLSSNNLCQCSLLVGGMTEKKLCLEECYIYRACCVTLNPYTYMTKSQFMFPPKIMIIWFWNEHLNMSNWIVQTIFFLKLFCNSFPLWMNDRLMNFQLTASIPMNMKLQILIFQLPASFWSNFIIKPSKWYDRVCWVSRSLLIYLFILK